MFANLFETSCLAQAILARTFLLQKDAKTIAKRNLHRLGAMLQSGPVYFIRPETLCKVLDFEVSEPHLAVPFLYGLRPYVVFACSKSYTVMPWTLEETHALDERTRELWTGALPVVDPQAPETQAAFQVLNGYFHTVPDKSRLTFFGVRPGGSQVFSCGL